MDMKDEASRLLNHPMITKFFAESKKKHHKIIESSLYHHDDIRMDSYLMLRALNELESCLNDYVSIGELPDAKVIKRLRSLD
jgi:hypothetical protein